MIVERAEHPRFLSNSYLVVDPTSRRAVVVDAGVEPAALFLRVEELGAVVEYVLLTHHHHDHVDHTAAWVERCGARVAAHALEAARLRGEAFRVDTLLEDDSELCVGALAIRCLHLPGHTDGQLGFLIESGDECRVFTGDTLFAGSVGGTLAPGHTNVQDLRHSILERLLVLPPATPVMPGHSAATTITAEEQANPFVLHWRAPQRARGEAVTVGRRAAQLLVEARDYDGGRKCLVRWEDGGEDVVPGSRVERRGAQ